MEVKHRLTIYIKSQGAEATPPLGTVIGNFGVSTVNFCKEFNTYTIDLPNFYILEVEILIFNNRTFKFSTKQPPLGSLINLLIKQRIKKKGDKEKIVNGILLKSVIELALWKFPKKPLEQSLPILLGKIKAANLKVWKKIN